MIKNKILTLTLFFTVTASLNIAFALPAEQNQLRVQTGESKRAGETAFSYLVAWRKGEASQHRANGLVFVNGFKSKNPSSAIDIARKTVKSLNGGINYDAPNERGAIAKHIKGEAEMLLSNRDGFDLTQATVRDYSNQELHYNLPNKSFSEASVKVAIDFVYSAAVEYVDGFSADIRNETAGGVIKVTIDKNAAIEIKTDGKSTKDIEKELAEVLGAKAQFSSTAIYPNYVELKSRNYKPFDGGEVQLLNLDAKSITIDVEDSGLGVLAKFNFPDVNKPTDVANKVPYIFGFLIAAALAYAFYTLKIKAKDERTV